MIKIIFTVIVLILCNVQAEEQGAPTIYGHCTDQVEYYIYMQLNTSTVVYAPKLEPVYMRCLPIAWKPGEYVKIFELNILKLNRTNT